MPQSNHKTLVRVLLWWVALLSICQAALLVLFFTMGHFGQSQNSDAQESPVVRGRHSDKSPSEPGISHDKVNVFTYKAKRDLTNYSVKWTAVNPPTDEEQSDIRMKYDAWVFVCLRITLVNCSKSEVTCNEVDEVNLVKDKETILTGWINNKTLSTGLLCKTERLLNHNYLTVQIKTKHPDKVKIQESQRLSSLDLIYRPD